MSSIPRHHAEWLSLLEISGPFLSMPVLLRVFPQGLDAHGPERAQVLRAAHEEWADNQQGTRPDPAIHHAWVRYVLGEMGFGEGMLLEGQAIPPGLVTEVPEHGVTLRPDVVIVDPGMVSRADSTLIPNPSPSREKGERKARMLIRVVEANQDLEKPLPGSRWQASVATQVMELLHATGVRLGLVTNGGQWMLVYAPRGETTGFISWYAHLWFDETLTLRAFQSLLGAGRFFGVPDGETLEAMLAESGKDQHEVTDQLGYQVRQAVEILIRDLDKADVDRGRKLLAEVGEGRLYEAALTVMMRLVFLLSAEERSLLPLDDPFYAENYAVSTLRVQLRELADRQGEDVLERRTDAWSRLLATFRAVYGGVQHDRLRLIAYGGSLFDPDRFPFLEGRRRKGKDESGGWRTEKSDPLPVDNRTVLHLLEALQILRVKVPGGYETRRLSFRALDIEQIGHVYEGLLDHVAVRAEEPVVGLAGTRDKEPEVALGRLEDLTQSREGTKTQRLGENERLLEFLQEETGRSRSALGNALAMEVDDFRLRRLRTACNNDEALFARVLPFAGLVRDDDNGFPVVVPSGSVYVTSGTARRATGTHYTPRSLTEPIVQHTLEPLVYVGPAEGKPKEAWILRKPEDLLALKICDMAMGSGAFLVQVVRYLAERLVESWDRWGTVEGSRLQVEGSPDLRETFTLQLSTLTPDDRLQLAKRLIADRCIYGVDKNPLAVEMAKLSLWLITLDKNRPFTFLDHSLKCGDSLVGASEDDYLRWAHRLLNDPRQAGSMTLFDQALHDQVAQAREKRKALQAFQVLDVRDTDRKTSLLKEADEAIARVKLGCDLIVGVKLLGLNASEQDALANRLLLSYSAGELDGEIDPTRHYDAARALNAARKERAFHWAFEFPEVFEGGGFSAFVGNPPFLWGNRISTVLGDHYRNWLSFLYSNYNGNADLCAHFFRRADDLLIKEKGCFGFISTNSISETHSRIYALESIVNEGSSIIRAQPNFKWPGPANLHVATVVMWKGSYKGSLFLDDNKVGKISSFLDATEFENPYKLFSQLEIGFKGVDTGGLGFIVSDDEFENIQAESQGSSTLIWPFMNGKDFLSDPQQRPSRLIINLTGLKEKEVRQHPSLLKIIEDRVLPYRMTVKRKRRRDNWWLYNETMPGLYESISKLKKCLVNCVVSKHICFDFANTHTVFSNALNIFATDSLGWFGLLQSTIHEAWARYFGSSLETRNRYNLTNCFETFPIPPSLFVIEATGGNYYEIRKQIMDSRQEGLTDTYNRFHDPEEAAPDIARLRALHVEMDEAVAGAYGWEDLDLGHGFHATAQGVRFTISEAARREVLGRLLAWNHRRWEEEGGEVNKVDRGKRGGEKGKKAKDPKQGQLF